MIRLVAALTSAALLLAPSLAIASPETDRIAALEARLAALESLLPAAPQPAPNPSRATVMASAVPVAMRFAGFAALGGVPPIFGARVMPGSFTGGTVPGATTFTSDVTFSGGTGALGFAAGETLVPADGVLNVTGALSASTYVVGGGKVTSGDSAINSGSSIYSNVDANDLMITAVTDNGSTAVALTLAAYDDFTMAGAKIISGGDKAGTTYVEKFAFMLDGAALFTPTALALSGAHTALPVGGIVEVTCTGAQTWTPTETAATNGEIHHIVNVGADALTMDHVAGQVLLNGGADVVLGQMDALTIYYSTAASAWVQLGATSNN